MINNTSLDDLDLALLGALQRNARSTFAELGALVGLKAPSVHDRVKRLEARGFIRRYAAQVDGRKLGFGLTAFVSCYVSSETTYDDFTANVAKLSEVCEVHSVAGEETYLLKVMTRSTEHLDDFLSRLKLVSGMIRTKTTIVLSTPFERGGVAIEHGEAPTRRLRSVR
jgi:Lrp/AsnC family transcriptional regulator, leucine-responsive regulatory protein